jgi:hypothetical protein
MLSVGNKPFILSVVILSVVAPITEPWYRLPRFKIFQNRPEKSLRNLPFFEALRVNSKPPKSQTCDQ